MQKVLDTQPIYLCAASQTCCTIVLLCAVVYSDTVNLGDIIYVKRYLGNPASSAAGTSLQTLRLKAIGISRTDVVCEAQNEAILDGLITIFQPACEGRTSPRSAAHGQPVLTDYDVHLLKVRQPQGASSRKQHCMSGARVYIMIRRSRLLSHVV